jgi:integrase
MPKKSKTRIYWRGGRAYGDFRDFADVGGGQERLVAPGARLATADPDVAAQLLSDRLKALEKKRSDLERGTVEKYRPPLAEFAADHLVKKARAGKVTDGWLSLTEDRLQSAVDHFGEGRDIRSIAVADVQEWVRELEKRPGRGGGTLSPGTVRHFLNALSNLYQRAQSEGHVDIGYNPVAAMLDKPTAARKEARWLEVHEAALFLESARTYTPKRGDIALPHLYPLIAAFLLTGGREKEVYGLEVEDVSFDRRTVTFRPNQWRRLKTSTSHRSVPLWPQLEEVLRPYVFGGNAPPRRLLFPATRVDKEQPITDLRKALDLVGKRAGWKEGEIRTRIFRHTYCATRLQTTDRGAPVSEFTVAREMGHGGTELVRRVYGHLGTVRHRSKAVEYRVEQHRKALGERLRELKNAR